MGTCCSQKGGHSIKCEQNLSDFLEKPTDSIDEKCTKPNLFDNSAENAKFLEQAKLIKSPNSLVNAFF